MNIFVKGDNLLTALCVARKCNMVPMNNRVILVEAFPGQENENAHDNTGVPPRIEWKLIETNSETLNDNDFPTYQTTSV